MKILSSCLLVLGLASCTLFGSRHPSNTEAKPVHHVITLHGVRGNAESYGEFHKYVNNTLKQIQPDYDYKVYNWTYPVGAAVDDKDQQGKSFKWNPHRIADQLNQDFFIGSKAKIPVLGENDKVSFIAYSMGGQMIMTWYYDTMFNFDNHPELQYNDQSKLQYLQNVLLKTEHIIGLGPVYWGSLESELGGSMLESKSYEKLYDTVPLLRQFCESPDIMSITGGKRMRDLVTEAAVKKIGAIWDSLLRKNVTTPVELTSAEEKVQIAKNILIPGCRAIYYNDEYIIGTKGKPFDRSRISAEDLQDKFEVNEALISTIASGMAKGGNTNISEVFHMRLSSDVINELRINTMRHLLNDSLRTKFKAKWTSIVGIFPCLGKANTGLACNEFMTPEFKKINQQLLNLFQGINRRETDGPVMGPGAVADFLFYTEQNFHPRITGAQFFHTKDLRAQSGSMSKEIYVENMHATLVPALESMAGAIGDYTKKFAAGMVDFDHSLNNDVVIMNSECATPDKCEHPNFRHIVETITNCDKMSSEDCNQDMLNKYFKVSSQGQRYAETDLLKNELGGFAVIMNIRLPLSYDTSRLKTSQDILNFIKVLGLKDYNTSSTFGTGRIDNADDAYAAQLTRKEQVMSSYAYIRKYSNIQMIKVILQGRVWSKNSGDAVGTKKLGYAQPFTFDVSLELPELPKRSIEVKSQGRFTTFLDLTYIN